MANGASGSSHGHRASFATFSAIKGLGEHSRQKTLRHCVCQCVGVNGVGVVVCLIYRHAHTHFNIVV